jgi:hypothetical protein
VESLKIYKSLDGKRFIKWRINELNLFFMLFIIIQSFSSRELDININKVYNTKNNRVNSAIKKIFEDINTLLKYIKINPEISPIKKIFIILNLIGMIPRCFFA